MFSLLVVLSAAFVWPSEPFTSKVDGTFNINGRFFNFSSASFGKGRITKRIDDDNMILLYSLFVPMERGDFGLSNDPGPLGSVVVCEDRLDDCRTALDLTDWEYRIINGKILMTSRSAKFSWNDEKYVLNSTVEINCFESGEEKADSSLHVDRGDAFDILNFYVTGHTGQACSYQMDVAPNSGIFDNGLFEQRINVKDQPSTGSWMVSANLTNLNRGLAGYHRHSNGRSVYWQPTEFVRCPPSFTCVGSGSVQGCAGEWCVTRGTTSREYIRAIGSEKTATLFMTYKATDYFGAKAEIKCDEDLPADYVVFDDVTIENDKMLHLKGESKNVCPVWKDYPQTNCVTDDGFDFATITKGTKTFRWGDLKVIGKPCGVTPCPSGYSCSGMEDARWWLCQEQTCIGFGNPDYFQTVYERLSDDKIQVKHYGLNGMKMTIQYQCDDDVDDLKLVGRIEVDGFGFDTNVDFKLKYPGDCEHPVEPTEPVEPTSGKEEFIPQVPADTGKPREKNVVETEFIYSNGAYYQAIDVSKIKNHVEKTVTATNTDDETASVVVKMSPWDLVEAPDGYGHTSGYERANIWTCWTLKSGTKYCHSTGNVNYGLTSDGSDDKIILHYQGLFNTSTTIVIECDTRVPGHEIEMEDRMLYNANSTWTEFVFYAEMSDICQKRLADPDIPSPPAEPTPTPDPSIVPSFTFTRPMGNDTKVEVDLSTMNAIDAKSIFVKRSDDGQLELASVIGDLSNVLACPEGYDCGNYSVANFWKCSQGQCFPASDLRYGMSIGSARVNEEPKMVDSSLGVTVEYSGGVGGYSVSVNMFCDVVTGVQVSSKATLDNSKLTLTAYSIDICPKGDSVDPITVQPEGRQLNASSIALIVIGVIAFAIASVVSVIYVVQRKMDSRDFVQDSSCPMTDESDNSKAETV